MLSKKISKLFFNFSKTNKPVFSQNQFPFDDPQIESIKYVHQINFNFEQNKEYIKKVNNQLEVSLKKEQLKDSPLAKPRRYRKQYDVPKHNTDLTNYSVWRNLDNPILKFGNHELPVVSKIWIAPYQLNKVFGQGIEPYRNKRATQEFDFEDSNMDKFLVYDYAQTQCTKKQFKSQNNGYKQDWESHKIKESEREMPSKSEFWNSQEPCYFRINSTKYADTHKFKKWIYSQVKLINQIDKMGSQSYEENVLKKHGAIDTYDDYNKDYELKTDMAIFKYDRSFFSKQVLNGVTMEKQSKNFIKEKAEEITEEDLMFDRTLRFLEKVSEPQLLDSQHKISKQ